MKKNANAEKFECENCPVDKRGLCDEHYSCVRMVWEAALKSKNAAASTNSQYEPCPQCHHIGGAEYESCPQCGFKW